MTYAPRQIEAFFSRLQEKVPFAVLAGIAGDANHSFGYHLGRDNLPANDYSVQMQLDQQGNADAASAIDLEWDSDNGSALNASRMRQVTAFLIQKALDRDPRLDAVREFCGTTDSTQTHPYDLSDGRNGPLGSWDASHLWHLHISFYRAYSEDEALLFPVADLIAEAFGAHTESLAPHQLSEEDEDDMACIVTSADANHQPVLCIGNQRVALSNAKSVLNLKAKGVPVYALAEKDYENVRSGKNA